MNMEMTRTFERMDKDKAWDILVEYMWENEEAHWIEEGRPNDHIFIALKTLNRFQNTTIEDDSDSDSEDEDDSDSDDEPEHEHDKRIEESELDRKAQQLIDLIIKELMRRMRNIKGRFVKKLSFIDMVRGLVLK